MHLLSITSAVQIALFEEQGRDQIYYYYYYYILLLLLLLLLYIHIGLLSMLFDCVTTWRF